MSLKHGAEICFKFFFAKPRGRQGHQPSLHLLFSLTFPFSFETSVPASFPLLLASSSRPSWARPRCQDRSPAAVSSVLTAHSRLQGAASGWSKPPALPTCRHSRRHLARPGSSAGPDPGPTCPTPPPRTSHTKSRGFQECSCPALPCCLHIGCSQDQSELGFLLSSLWKHIFPTMEGPTGGLGLQALVCLYPTLHLPESLSQPAAAPKAHRGTQNHTRCQSSLFLGSPPQGQETLDAAPQVTRPIAIFFHPTSRPHRVHLYNGSTQAFPIAQGGTEPLGAGRPTGRTCPGSQGQPHLGPGQADTSQDSRAGQARPWGPTNRCLYRPEELGRERRPQWALFSPC